MARPPAAAALARAWHLLRKSWRQLTSMRTALILLFLLALAAVPSSVLPQRDGNAGRVSQYLADHPRLGPVLDRLWAFDVFSSPWFSAIYLLLFTSLVGCVVPRLRDQVRSLRSAPPAGPARLDRLPRYAGGVLHHGDVASVAALLRRHRWRTVVRGQTVCAEKGYLKEAGNLLFHLALVGVLAGVAMGSWYGWHANRLVVAGPDGAFCNTVQQYDEYGLGARVDAGDLAPFCFALTDFQASYLDNGQPVSFAASAELTGPAAGGVRSVRFSVNAPLRLAGANVYLLGHGYAPVLRYTDRYGQVQTTVAPFLSNDEALTSEGVATFPDVNRREPGKQVGFAGLYLPTAPENGPFTRSLHPQERSPALLLFAYRGDLGLDVGIPQSVYTLNERQIRAGRLTQVGEPKLLRPGESWTLDDGSTVEFLGTRPWVSLAIRYDPGEPVVLVSVALLLVGLLAALPGKRRRVWVRVTPAGEPRRSLIEVGGLPRTEYPGFGAEFDTLVRRLGGSA